MLTLDKIYQASYALKRVIRHTDLISAPNINKDSFIYLKPENLQVTGSFKVRGACFKMMRKRMASSPARRATMHKASRSQPRHMASSR